MKNFSGAYRESGLFEPDPKPCTMEDIMSEPTIKDENKCLTFYCPCCGYEIRSWYKEIIMPCHSLEAIGEYGTKECSNCRNTIGISIFGTNLNLSILIPVLKGYK